MTSPSEQNIDIQALVGYIEEIIESTRHIVWLLERKKILKRK